MKTNSLQKIERMHELKQIISEETGKLGIKEFVKNYTLDDCLPVRIFFKNLSTEEKDFLMSASGIKIDNLDLFNLLSVEPSFDSTDKILWNILIEENLLDQQWVDNKILNHVRFAYLNLIKIFFKGYFLEEYLSFIDPNNEIHLDERFIEACQNSWNREEFFTKNYKKDINEYYTLTGYYPIQFPLHPKEILYLQDTNYNMDGIAVPRTNIFKRFNFSDARTILKKIINRANSFGKYEAIFILLNYLSAIEVKTFHESKELFSNEEDFIKKIKSENFEIDHDKYEELFQKFQDEFKDYVLKNMDLGEEFYNDIIEILEILSDGDNEEKPTEETGPIIGTKGNIYNMKNIDTSNLNLEEMSVEELKNISPEILFKKALEKIGEDGLMEFLEKSTIEELPEELKDSMKDIAGENKKNVTVRSISLEDMIEIIKK